MILRFGRRPLIQRVSLGIVTIVLCVVINGNQRSQAQFTFLNQIAAGPVNSPGYIPLPLMIGNTGPDGQFLITEGFFGNDNLVKAYAADGSYLRTLSSILNEPIGSAIGPDGTYYVSYNLTETVGVFSSSGTFVRDLPNVNGGVASPTGVAASSTGTLYVANNTQIEVYSTTFNGTNYPLVGTFGAAGSGPGQFSGGIGALTLDPVGANLYVTDPGNHRIQVFTSGGTYVSSIGDASGPGQLLQPYGVGVSGTGRVYVADSGTGIKVFSTSGTYQQTVAASINGQSLQSTSVAVAPTGMVYVAGVANGQAGAYRYFDPASWSSGTNSFTNAATGPTNVAVGVNQLLGMNLNLNAGKGLVVGQTTTVNNAGSLTLSGGSLTTNSLVVDGTSSSANFTMTGGSLSANSIVVQGGGVADFVGQPLTVSLNGTVSIPDAGSQFKVEQGATVSALALSNGGNVVVSTGADFVVLNNSFNLGTVTLNGGELDVRGLFGNGPTAKIQGSGTLSTTTGLSNGGQIQFTGQSSVMGAVNNLSNGLIQISGQQSHTFFGAVSNDGTLSIDNGVSVSFQGAFSGAHGIAGTGTAIFSGGLVPGDPVQMAFGGNVVLQQSNTTTMHLAGTTPGSGYDQVDVAGQLTLNGALQLILQSFTPQVGQSFHLFDWGTATGAFSQLILPALPGGESWNTSRLNSQGTISVTITGDVNGDGIVNGQDLATISSNWLSAGTGRAGDANNDGIVNGQDLALVSANWLASGPPVTANAAAVPEPSGLLLAAFALVATLVWKRRS